MPRRVVQVSTGNVGTAYARSILGRADLELVGLHANGATKVGRDAAELCGLRDLSACGHRRHEVLVALGPDCASTRHRPNRPTEALAEIGSFPATVRCRGRCWSGSIAPSCKPTTGCGNPRGTRMQAGDTSLCITGIDGGLRRPPRLHGVGSPVASRRITVQEICMTSAATTMPSSSVDSAGFVAALTRSLISLFDACVVVGPPCPTLAEFGLGAATAADRSPARHQPVAASASTDSGDRCIAARCGRRCHFWSMVVEGIWIPVGPHQGTPFSACVGMPGQAAASCSSVAELTVTVLPHRDVFFVLGCDDGTNRAIPLGQRTNS